MANTVFKLRRSTVAGKVPNTSTLSIGELALNLTDQKLFSSDGSNIFELGSNVTSQYVYSTISVGNSSVNTTINSTSINIKSIIANSSLGTANQVLTSNGTGIYWASPSAGSTGGSNTQILYNDSGASNGSANFIFNKSTNTITIGSSSNTFNTFFGNSSFHGYAKTDLQNKFVDFGVESSNTLGNFGSYFYLNGTNPQMWASAFPSDGSQMYIDFYVVGANQTIGSATLESVYYKGFPGGNEKNILNRFISNSTTSYYESSYSNTADGVYNSVVTVTNSSVSSITLGNSSVNTVVNSTTFSGTANNANYVKANNGITSNSFGVFVTQGTGIVVNATGVHVNSAYINTISSNLSYYVIANSGIVSNSSGVFVNASYIGTLTANNTSFVGSISAANVVSNAQLSSNLSNYQTTAGLSANVAKLTANNSTNLNGQSASYYTNASNINTGTLPYAQIPANIINTTAAFTISGIHTYSANIILGSSGLSANGSFGTAGHVLHSNGTATYWAADDVGGTVAGSNTQLQFNDSGVANATAGFTFNKTSNTISVGNSTVNTTANSASFLPGLMYHNYQNINIDYTIANNYSASMVGPVTIAAGKTLTVNSGARFVVI